MTLIKQVRDAVGIYLLWIGLHFISSHIYARYCAGNTIVMVLLSPFLVPTPYCSAIRWIIFKGANAIDVMWIIAGKWAVEQIVVKNLFPPGIKAE